MLGSGNSQEADRKRSPITPITVGVVVVLLMVGTVSVVSTNSSQEASGKVNLEKADENTPYGWMSSSQLQLVSDEVQPKQDAAFSAATPPAGEYISAVRTYGGSGWTTGIQVWYNTANQAGAASATYGPPYYHSYEQYVCPPQHYIKKVIYRMGKAGTHSNNQGQLINMNFVCSDGNAAAHTHSGPEVVGVGFSTNQFSTEHTKDLPGPLTGFSGTAHNVRSYNAFVTIVFHAYTQGTCTWNSISPME